MARVRTAYGRFIKAADLDPLEDFLARAGEAPAPRHQAVRNPPGAPTGGVVIFGQGRMGSWAAYILARLGIPLALLDRDVVEAHNLAAGNCVFRSADVGMPKVLAMKKLLAQEVSDLPVEVYQEDITLMPEVALRGLSERAGVALGLVDEGEAIFHINDVLYPHISVIYAAGHRGAHSGDVVISRPGGACLRCLLDIDSPAQVQTLSGETTHGIDILTIAQTCVKVALVLLGDSRLGDPREVFDPSTNFIFLENRRSRTNPRGFAPRFLRVDRRRTCPVCGAVQKGNDDER